jgi:transcriptional regulator of acetoin/glycerol metabolism
VELQVDRPVPVVDSAAAAPIRPVSLPGKSPAVAQAIAHATRLAARSVPMLIEGEPGVGKFALARAVLASARVDPGRTVVLDASSAATERGFVTLLLRELEQEPDALLLRRVEALSPEQATATAGILELLEEQPHAPRVVATMTTTAEPHPGLRRLVDTVGVGRVTLPPLRDRHEDIAPTAVAILDKHRGPKQLRFSSAALRLLMRAPWPGNLRQLDSTIRGLLSTCIGPEIRPDDLPLDLQGNSRKRDLSAIEELELSAILNALRQHNGNKVAAAHAIGISRSTLYRKLQAYRLDPDKQYF